MSAANWWRCSKLTIYESPPPPPPPQQPERPEVGGWSSSTMVTTFRRVDVGRVDPRADAAASSSAWSIIPVSYTTTYLYQVYG